MRSSPDPLLSEAGASGELLVARIRLALAGMLLLVPVVSFILSPHWEDLVGLTVAVVAFLLSVVVYVLVAKDYSRNASVIGGNACLDLRITERFVSRALNCHP